MALFATMLLLFNSESKILPSIALPTAGPTHEEGIYKFVNGKYILVK